MQGVNKVLLLGNLGNDPELRYTKVRGQAVCNFRMATSSRWKDTNGDLQNRTEWHRIVVWGNQANACKEFLSKGSGVFLEGRMQTRQWEDRDGNKRYTTEVVVAGQVTFLPRPTPTPDTNEEPTNTADYEDDAPF